MRILFALLLCLQTSLSSDLEGALALGQGNRYSGAVLSLWVTTNNTVSLQWKKAPQVEEFSGSTVIFTTFTANSGSSAASAAVDTSESGLYSSSTGSLTNGTAGLRGVTSTMLFTTNDMAVLWRIKTPSILSSDVDGYELYSGLGDSVGDAAPVDGAYFYYLHSVNSGAWLGRTVSNSSVTPASGGATVSVVANTWYNLLLEGNATRVNFWVSSDDGATWAWIGFTSANIPSSTARTIGLEAYLRKVGGSSGTATRTTYFGRTEIWAAFGN